MSKVAFWGVVSALVFLSWDAAVADQARYLCLPEPGNDKAGYSVQCEVRDKALVADSCKCDVQFVLVDPNGPSQITPPRAISNQ